MAMHAEDPRLARRVEVHSLVRQAAKLDRRVDGYFGDSAFYGVASPVDLPNGLRGVRFEWLGPAETRGEVLFTPDLCVAEATASGTNG